MDRSDASALDNFKASLAEWAEALIRPYVDDLKGFGDGTSTCPKEFNDAVWGTVVLSPLEVVLLDSPLLQRLRHIRQLGVVHLVYPSATHTRFEHTIGTIHQVSRLVAGLNAHAKVVNEQLESLLRVTALCHDIGHGVMSHVSENAMRDSKVSREVMRQFSRELDRERGKMSEASAYCIVRSKAFMELLTEAQRVTGDHGLPSDAVELISTAVVGGKISNSMPLLHELISGPFDADKLDYMTRDARMSGVPVVTDIPRLVQKVRARQLSEEDLPHDVQEQVHSGEPVYTLTGISLSGGRTLDELMFGQTLLYDKLYRHQKVRAAEAMIAAIIDQVAPLCKSGELLASYELRDDEIVHMNEAVIKRLVGRALTKKEKYAAARAIDISRRLSSRQLFRRAYAFAQNMPLDPYRNETEHYLGLVTMTADVRSPVERRKLVERIAEEVYGVLEALGEGGCRNNYPGNDVRPYIRLDPPNATTQGNDTARAYLISDADSGSPVLRFKDEYAETTGWSNAYLLTRDTGYIFTTKELVLPVYLAMEKIARVDYNVRTPSSMLAYAKQDAKEVEKAKGILEKANFYEGTAYDLRPLPPRFRKASYRVRLEAVEKKLSGYQGPVRDGQEDKRASVLSGPRIEAWVRQFGTKYADSALGLAEMISMVGRDQIGAATKAFLEGHDDFRGGSVTPLGDAKDSSALTTYYAGDNSSLYIRNLPEALSRDAPIIFVEDFVGTGAQTITILQGWLGLELSHELHEERESPLPGGLQALLRDRKLAIVYAAGDRRGASEVQRVGRDMGLDLEVYLHNEEAPVAFSNGQRSAFKSRCEEIGRALLADEDSRHDADWVAQRALGYGNRGFLVVFPYNTPTQSLTCLWKAGIVDGIEWVPLLPRRPKN